MLVLLPAFFMLPALGDNSGSSNSVISSLTGSTTNLPEPLLIVQSQTNILLSELSNRKTEFDENPQSLIQFAKNVALTHWDIEKTSRLMLGKYWREAAPEEQNQFETEFLRTLLRYVVKAYGFYDESLVEVVSYDWHPKGKSGWVKSKVRIPGGIKVNVDYRMNKNDKGDWKLIDVRVEGISLVSSKRNEYRAVIRESGFSGLIEGMSEKNQKVLSF